MCGICGFTGKADHDTLKKMTYSLFHRVQHVRCFNKDSLLSLMKTYGFHTLFCQSINLEDYKKNNFKRLIRFLYRRIFRNSVKKPHLVFIGQNNA